MVPAATGGFVGATMASQPFGLVLLEGYFSNEAGLGSAPIVAAVSQDQ